MKQGKFTAKERAYLMSLPAVESVTSERIFYAERFKTECMRRYHEGESPTKIFNDAGLYSSLIGYKRIERCIARWRADERSGRLNGEYETSDMMVSNLPGEAVTPRFLGNGANGARNARWPVDARAPRPVQDVSGLLLMRYESRLRTLEKRIALMAERIDRMERSVARSMSEALIEADDDSAACTDARIWIMEDMRVIAGRFKGLELKAAKNGTRPTTDRTKEAIFSRLESWAVLEDARVLDLFAGTGALGIEALSRGARELVSVESAAPAASLISGAFAELRHNRAWERGMSVRLVRKRAEQYVIGTMRVPQDGAATHPEFSGKLPGGTGTGMEGVVPNTTIHDGADGAAVASGEVSSVVAAGGAARSQAFDVIFIDPPYAFTTEACNRLLADLVVSGLAVPHTVIVLERSTRSDDPTPPEGWQVTDRRDYGETAVHYIEAAV
ncbi:methyltransferase [Bifidobacterium pullorum subsp. gallinarum]|uniref:Methyltransferase n=1 Tax=Bifidobacterium pullorum subsp. gallinarum TaxID=78344 RepID=A0A087AP05_9BIFI|nr:methyltransferase [Bifidobacterium pullorum subsp. gallinarum]